MSPLYFWLLCWAVLLVWLIAGLFLETKMTTDHAPRIIAQQQQAAENAAIEELETRTAPLFWAVYLVTFAAVFVIAVDGWQHYKTLAAEHEYLVSCLNGQSVGMGDAVLRCQVSQYHLVGGQP